MRSVNAVKTPYLASRKARRAEQRQRRKKHSRPPSRANARQVPSTASSKLTEAADCYSAGRLHEAELCYRQVLQADPDCAFAHYGLGRVFGRAGQPRAAYDCYKRALELDDTNPEYWTRLGHALTQLHEHQACVIALTNAVARSPGNAASLCDLGYAFYRIGQGAEALAAFRKAIELDRNAVRAHLGLGSQLLALGEKEEARDVYRHVLEHIDPECVVACSRLIELASTPGETDRYIDCMSGLMGRFDDAQRRSAVHFGIAKGRRKQKRYDDAFVSCAAANDCLKEAYPFKRELLVEVVDANISGYRSGVTDKLQSAGCDSDLPVFIVGMPRSGSTLTEQIITSHPDVADAGEFMGLARSANLLRTQSGGNKRYPRDIASLDPEMLSGLGQDYLAALGLGHSASARRITDKQLNNFFHIGLIAVLFPNAAIIHCRRNPLDTCLSCYFQDFHDPAGNLSYCSDLEDLGFYYREYERLMAHWRQVLPGRLLEVDYEEIIADQEGMSRRIIEHVGLEWSDSCLEFYKQRRTVRTASVDQVRRPIYNSSVGAWRNYESHLAPLKAALGVAE